MKKLCLFIVVLAIACTKTSLSPITIASSDEVVSGTVSFYEGVPQTVYLSPGLNTLQTDSFTTSELCYPLKFIFKAEGVTDQLRTGGFTLYIDGAQTRTTISREGELITVAMRQKQGYTGTHTYVLQGKTTYGHPGFTFNMQLVEAIFVYPSYLNLTTLGLPQVGNNFILLK